MIKKIIVSVILIGAIGLIFFGLHWNEQQEKGRKRQLVLSQKVSLEILFKAAQQLTHYWHEGDIDNVIKKKSLTCPFADNSPYQYLRCNPSFVECVTQKALIVIHEGTKYKVRAKKQVEVDKNYSIITRSNSKGVMIPKYAVMVELFIEGSSDFSLKILL